MAEFTSYRGQQIALTFSSIIKTGDSGTVPFTTTGRGEPTVFTNNLRTQTPNALVGLSDGNGTATSLAIGAKFAGAKVFGPTQICNVGTAGGGEATTATLFCVDGGKAVMTHGLDVTGAIAGTTTMIAAGCVQGNFIKSTGDVCSVGEVNADDKITSQEHICTTGSGKCIKGPIICGTTCISTEGDIIAFSTSDKELKNNLIPIDSSKILSKINGYEYDWNDKTDKEGHSYGVLAQEVQEVMPEAVRVNSNNYLAVDYEKLIPVLIQEVKSLNNRITSLESKING